MGRQKRDHYVPQFLLRRFSQIDKPGLLYRLDLAAGVIRPAQVRTEAQQQDLNTLADDVARDLGVDARMLEDVYQQIENQAAPAVRRMTSPGWDFNREDRTAIATLVAAQLSRTPRRQAWMRQLMQVGGELYAEAQIGDSDHVRRIFFDDEPVPDEVVGAKQRELYDDFKAGRWGVEVDDDEFKVGLLAHLPDLVLALVNETKWVLGCCPRGHHLVLGDDPAVLYDPAPCVPGAAPGPLSSDHSETVLPLDPTTALILFPGEPRFGRAELDAEQIDDINLRTAAWSVAGIYARRKHDLTELRRLMQRRPDRLAQLAATPPRLYVLDTVEGDHENATVYRHDGDGGEHVEHVAVRLAQPERGDQRRPG